MRYETLAKKLARYERTTKGDTTFYLLNGKVVATEKRNIIVMYFYCSRDVIWNHHDVVAVAVAKDFVIVNNYEKTIADVVTVNGLCGAYNTIERMSNRLLKVGISKKLSFEAMESIGTIGHVAEAGVFKFYDYSITITI